MGKAGPLAIDSLSKLPRKATAAVAEVVTVKNISVPLFPQVRRQRRLPPSPSFPVEVEIDRRDDKAVISGTQARMAPGDPRGRRFRVWWIK